jgi:hypothetical protein
MTKDELKQLEVITSRVNLLPNILSMKQQLLSSIHHQHYHHPKYHPIDRKPRSSSLSDLPISLTLIDSDIDKNISTISTSLSSLMDHNSTSSMSSQAIPSLTRISTSLSTDINQSYAILSLASLNEANSANTINNLPNLSNQDNIMLATLDSIIYKNAVQIVDLLLIPRVSKSNKSTLNVFKTFFLCCEIVSYL